MSALYELPLTMFTLGMKAAAALLYAALPVALVICARAFVRILCDEDPWWNPNTDGPWRFMQRRTIGDDDPFMVRYTILGTPKIDLKIHHLFRPDQDPDLHTHPWWMLAVILTGGYIEQRPPVYPKGLTNPDPWPDVCPRRHIWRRPGHPYFMRHGAAHRIDHLLRPAFAGGSWSLVITGPKHHNPGWGYIVDGTWIDEATYLARKAAT